MLVARFKAPIQRSFAGPSVLAWVIHSLAVRD